MIDAGSDTVIKTVRLAAKATGFQSNGATLESFDVVYLIMLHRLPELLESIVADRAYVPKRPRRPMA